MLKGVFCALFLASSHLFGQTFVSAGYGWPGLISVAPGQILSFFANGLNEPLTGITVALRQNNVNTPVPVQSIQAASLCPDSFNAVQLTCGMLAAITVQIPYEISADATLFVSQNGQAGMAIELIPVSDQVHVLSECDIVLGGAQFLRQPNLTGLPCTPVVTHANGIRVNAFTPANVGEELIAWVFGLGQTNPPAITGQPSETAPAAGTFYLDFNYQVNALATKPLAGDPDRIPPRPLFAGLTSGFVGLYQVNFIVPPAPPNGIVNCAPGGSFTPGANVAQSNLTVSIGGQYSFDGAGICVATQIPVD